MTFGEAIEEIKNGARVTRSGWNGKGMFIALHIPVRVEMMDEPYIYMKPVSGKLIPWLASQSDMLADDWSAVDQ